MPHLPCCHLEAVVDQRLKALHQPLGAGEALSRQEGVKVPGVSAHRERDIQDAPAQIDPRSSLPCTLQMVVRKAESGCSTTTDMGNMPSVCISM